MRKPDPRVEAITVGEYIADGFKLALIFLVTFALLALPEPAKSEPLATCAEIGDAAAEIMGYRQDEIPLSAIMQAAEGSPFVEAMILRAYSRPAFQTEENRTRLVQEFRNAEELRCYTALGGLD
jgi:hypothetical protein